MLLYLDTGITKQIFSDAACGSLEAEEVIPIGRCLDDATDPAVSVEYFCSSGSELPVAFDSVVLR